MTPEQAGDARAESGGAQKDPAPALVTALETARHAAMRTGDWRSLETVLHDKIQYTHSNGTREDKESYLRSMRDGTLVYDSIDFAITDVMEFDGFAVAYGTLTAQVSRAGKTIRLNNTTTAVWLEVDASYQLVAYQGTPSER